VSELNLASFSDTATCEVLVFFWLAVPDADRRVYNSVSDQQGLK
jgi:hypothetical protein